MTPEWIVEKTGIRRRYLAAPDDTASGFAVAAARQAMDAAGVGPDEIDMIVACTFSGDYTFPPLSAKVHKELGVRGGQIFDLQANCAGFVAGLTAASDRMAADPAVRHALVVGVEMNSRYIDRGNLDSVIYHSDGAGAAVLGRRAGRRRSSPRPSTPTRRTTRRCRVRGGGSSFPVMAHAGRTDADVMELNGLATWKQAITHLPAVVKNACRKAEVELADVDFFVFHQANYNLDRLRGAQDGRRHGAHPHQRARDRQHRRGLGRHRAQRSDGRRPDPAGRHGGAGGGGRRLQLRGQRLALA